MKIALCQINTTVGDLSGNAKKIIEYTSRAKRFGCDLAVFPELAVTGYPLRDMVDNSEFVQKSQETLSYIAEKIPSDIAIIVGCVFGLDGKRPYNAAYFISNNLVEFAQFKSLLPNYDVFDEQRNYSSGENTPKDIVDFKGVKLGISICEDAWANDMPNLYSVDPIEELVGKGAEMIINISASPFCDGKWDKRRKLMSDIATTHKVPVVYVNSVGGNDSLVFDGGSFVTDKGGNIRSLASEFSECIAFYDTDKTEVIEVNDAVDSIGKVKNALVLGIRDYVRKCGFERVVIGLSGGIDSAVVASLAVEALGKENVTGILMPSGYSSSHSVTDAVELANNLGIGYVIHEIGTVLEAYKKVLGDMVKGLAEENLQARTRGNYLLGYSNSRPKTMVLSTSNRSESAVGYFTIYGDAVGGIAPIGDLLKTQVYGLANYINSEHKSPVIPFNTIHKEPSAELAPNQIDLNSLPPYNVLDEILVLYIEERLSAKEISDRSGNDIELVEKIIKMVERNEFKRQQVPMNIKVSKMNFGLGRRLPIARKF
jgi:NAD+ synthase (glutamine-hydrolysing)